MTTAPRRSRRPKFLPALPPGAAANNDDRNAWLDEVIADKTLPPTTRLVAIAYGRRVNHQTGWTWTGAATVAADTGQRRGDIRRHLDVLVNGGERANKANPGRPHRSRPYLHQISTGPGGFTLTALLMPEPGSNVRTGFIGDGHEAPEPGSNVRTGNADAGEPDDAGGKYPPSSPNLAGNSVETWQEYASNLAGDCGTYLRNQNVVSTSGQDHVVDDASSSPSGSDASSDLRQLIREASSNDECAELWRAHKDAWTDAHTDAVRARLAELATDGGAA